uniref:HCP-like protein n=1 Tax=Lotharella globosa TaxID=91324 RepID=A0A7S3Z6Z8_9EUKA
MESADSDQEDVDQEIVMMQILRDEMPEVKDHEMIESSGETILMVKRLKRLQHIVLSDEEKHLKTDLAQANKLLEEAMTESPEVGVPPKTDTAARLLLKASVMGSRAAEGLCYLFGIGQKDDKEKAMETFSEAANMGNRIAQAYLGYSYHQSRPEKTNHEKKAVKWYMKAADQGHTFSERWIGWVYQQGFCKDHEKSIQIALKYYERASAKGDGYSTFQLGQIYECGQGLKPSPSRALEYYKRGEAFGDPSCMAQIGILYRDGYGVEEDRQRAVLQFWRAADAGHRDVADFLFESEWREDVTNFFKELHTVCKLSVHVFSSV